MSRGNQRAVNLDRQCLVFAMLPQSRAGKGNGDSSIRQVEDRKIEAGRQNERGDKSKSRSPRGEVLP